MKKRPNLKEKIAALYPLLQRRAYMFCRHREDAEDLAMETVCRMLENCGSYNSAFLLHTWGYAIMRNTFLTWQSVRNRIFRPGNPDLTDGTAVPGQDIDYKILLERILRIAERKQQIRTCSGQEAILYAEGYSYREIAGMMNIPTGTVRSRISTGRKLLKRWLGQASPPIGLKNVTKQERTELSAKKRVTTDRTPEHSTDTTMRAIFLTELAMQYFPGNTQKSAANQLKRWIELNPELRARLSELHYRKGQRALTPLQHAAIVRFLGEPG